MLLLGTISIKGVLHQPKKETSRASKLYNLDYGSVCDKIFILISSSMSFVKTKYSLKPSFPYPQKMRVKTKTKMKPTFGIHVILALVFKWHSSHYDLLHDDGK